MSAKSFDRRPAVAIIGKTPPPIGGVTIHVSRLLRRLEEDDVSFVHFHPGKHSWLALPAVILRAKAVHMHVSNSYLLLFLTLLCATMRRKSLLTIHANLGCFGAIRNAFDQVAVRLADKPIVLNANSLTTALALNPKAELIPAFIPPGTDVKTAEAVTPMILDWKGQRAPLFCTNAFSRVFDVDGADIYGAESLLKIFRAIPNAGLVFSDPSGTYSEHFKRTGTVLPENVLVISEPHSFIEVLRSCDCMIRATTTDGDSISVKEALYLGINVIASDCVTRPAGCFIYPKGDNVSLARLIKEFKRSEVLCPVEDAFPLLIKAYRNLGVGVLQLMQRGRETE